MAIIARFLALFSLVMIPLSNAQQASLNHQPAPFYSSQFLTPNPPLINTEFQANLMQHKFDAIGNNRHILGGFLYLSPSNGKIRLDTAGAGRFESSLFDFTNQTKAGLVSNVILSYSDSVSTATCGYFFTSPFIIPFTGDILNTTGAVYTGYQNDELYGQVNTWTFSFAPANAIVKMFIDANNTLVRYDFALPGPARTFTTTRFFNIIQGTIDASVFETACLPGKKA